jgi:uncharacterized membrane protein
MGYAIAVTAIFLATHIAFAEAPLRGWSVRLLGERPFAYLYSAIAILQVIWLGRAVEAAPLVIYWQPPDWAPLVSIAVMPLVLLLLVCGFSQNNPTATLAPDAVKRRKVVGILAITRNPVMWGLGLWSLAHLIAVAEAAQALRFAAFAALALLGTLRVEQKQRVKWGDEAWTDFTARSSNLPFLAMLRGRAKLSWREIGWARLVVAAALYLAIILWFHPAVIGRAVWL